jgi:isopentenyl-diphosphate Delta-isomerase
MDGTTLADLIPAWDEDGIFRPMDKMDVHRRGLRHKAISVFVMSGSEVLLQRRALGKYHTPGLWANTCCTHPHWGEDDLTCAYRRLREELGIDRLLLVPLIDVEYRADVGGGLTEHELVRLFVARATRDLVIEPNPDEVAETAWVDLRDLAVEVRRHPTAYTPWLRIYLERHLDALSVPGRDAPRAPAMVAARR